MTSEWETGRFAAVGREPTELDAGGVAALLRVMAADLEAEPTAWENHTLARYLEALSAVLDDRYAQPGDALPAQPTWSMVADLLVTASGYE